MKKVATLFMLMAILFVVAVPAFAKESNKGEYTATPLSASEVRAFESIKQGQAMKLTASQAQMIAVEKMKQQAFLEENNMVLVETSNYSYEADGLLHVVTERRYVQQSKDSLDGVDMFSENGKNITATRDGFEAVEKEESIYDARDSRVYHGTYFAYLSGTVSGGTVGYNSMAAYQTGWSAGSDFSVGNEYYNFGSRYTYMYLSVPYSYTDIQGTFRKFTDSTLTIRA